MRILTPAFTVLFLALSFAGSASAVDFQEELQRLAQENATGYIGPFSTAFGSLMNSGLYHTARPHAILGFDISVKLSAVQVSDQDKTYDFLFPHLPLPLPANPIRPDTITLDLNQFYPNRATSTVFGENPAPTLTPDASGVDNALAQGLRDAGWTDAEITTLQALPEWSQLRNDLIAQIPPFQSVPGIGIDGLPMVMPQVSVGLPFKTEVLLRYIPEVDAGDVGKFKYLGIGVKHSISQYIPMFPADVSAQFVTQKLEIGDLLESNHWALNLEGSKKLGFAALSLTPYLGLGLEGSNLSVGYTITGSTTPDFDGDGVGDFEGQRVGFDLEGKNKSRVTAGLRLGLAFITINADYSIGRYNMAGLGVGLTLR